MHPKFAFPIAALALLGASLVLVWQLDILSIQYWYNSGLQKLIMLGALGVIVAINVLDYQKSKSLSISALTIFLFCCMSAIYYLFIK